MSAGLSHRSSFRRAGVAIGLVSALVACSASEPEADMESRFAVSDTIDAPDPDPDPDAEREQPGVTTVESTPVAASLGDVEVAMVQRLPRLELRWTDVELDLPEGGRTSMNLVFVGFVDGEMVAVAQSWPTPQLQALLTWRSTDGETWLRSDQEMGTGTSVHAVFALNDQLVATGQRQGSDGTEMVVLHTDPEGVWQPIDLRLAGIDPSGLSTWLHASSGQGVVMVAERFHPVPDSPLTIDTDDHRLVLDESAGSYELIDLASGEMVAGGPTSEIYPWREDGQAIWRVDTAELLTVVPWEVWEGAWSGGPPLPIPVPVDPARRTVEWDGYQIVLDDAADRVEVTELTTGELIVSASHEEFFRGPAPRFRDDATGDVVWSLTWTEWDELVQLAYANQVQPPVGAEPRRSVLVSRDGIVWTEVDFGGAGDSHVESLWSISGEYQLVVVDYETGEPNRNLYRSNDGVDWTSVPLDDAEAFVLPATSGPGGAIAVATPMMGAGYPTLTTSLDGTTWTPAFQLGEQDDGRHAWFDVVASGPGGHAALVTLVPQDEPEPLTITVGDHTARFGDGEPAFTITDSTGDVLLVADWHELEMAASGELESIVTYDDGVTTFWSPDGSVVMQIPDEAVTTAYDARHRAHLAGTDRMLFLERGETWYEVEVPLEGDAFVHALAIGDEAVLLGANHWGDGGFGCCDGEMGVGTTTLRVLVGHLDDAAR